MSKRIGLVIIVILAALLLIACTSSEDVSKDKEPKIEIAKVPHATVGAFENCVMCHAAAKDLEIHQAWDNKNCLICHKASDEVAPVEEAPAEEPAVEEPAVEEPAVEEPAVEEPKAEDPKVEQPKAEEPKVEQPKAEEPKVEQPKAEEPKFEVPILTLSAMHASLNDCLSCHTGGAMFTTMKPNHAIDTTYASCETCHTIVK